MLIRAEAEGTDTYELNRNLVLTDGARADSVPNLEIETGEIVGAGHASATGRFDDEQLFYLQSRGIPEDEARRLVVRGFFAERDRPDRRPRGRSSACSRAVEAELERVGALSVAEFVRACAVDDVADGTAIRVVHRRRPGGGRPRATATFYAVHDVCSHADVALSEGEVEAARSSAGCTARASTCAPASPTGLPATQPVPVYPVKIDGDDVLRRPSRRRAEAP